MCFLRAVEWSCGCEYRSWHECDYEGPKGKECARYIEGVGPRTSVENWNIGTCCSPNCCQKKIDQKIKYLNGLMRNQPGNQGYQIPRSIADNQKQYGKVMKEHLETCLPKFCQNLFKLNCMRRDMNEREFTPHHIIHYASAHLSQQDLLALVTDDVWRTYVLRMKDKKGVGRDLRTSVEHYDVLKAALYYPSRPTLRPLSTAAGQSSGSASLQLSGLPINRTAVDDTKLEEAKAQLLNLCADYYEWPDLPPYPTTREDLESTFCNRQAVCWDHKCELMAIYKILQGSPYLTQEQWTSLSQQFASASDMIQTKSLAARYWYLNPPPSYHAARGKFTGPQTDTQLMRSVHTTVAGLQQQRFDLSRWQVLEFHQVLNTIIARFPTMQKFEEIPSTGIPTYFSNRSVYFKRLTDAIPALLAKAQASRGQKFDIISQLPEDEFNDIRTCVDVALDVLHDLLGADGIWYRIQIEEGKDSIKQAGRQDRSQRSQSVSSRGSVPSLGSVGEHNDENNNDFPSPSASKKTRTTEPDSQSSLTTAGPVSGKGKGRAA